MSAPYGFLAECRGGPASRSPSHPVPAYSLSRNPLIAGTGTKNNTLRQGTTARRLQYAGGQVQNPPNSISARQFRCPETNKRKINALLWAAFPARSAHEVSQRAGAVLDRDPRTIRSWMEGRTKPDWTEVGMIAGYVGIEKAMQIIFGARN